MNKYCEMGSLTILAVFILYYALITFLTNKQ